METSSLKLKKGSRQSDPTSANLLKPLMNKCKVYIFFNLHISIRHTQMMQSFLPKTWIKELKKRSFRFRNILFSIQILKNVKLQERAMKFVDLYIVITTITSVPFPYSKTKQNEKIKLYRNNNKKSNFTGIMADSNSYCLGQICF